MPRDNADLSALGAFIREQRTRMQLTQAQLAERLGWSREHISVLETGTYGVPSVPILVRLAESLDVPVLALLDALGFPMTPSSLNGSSPRPAQGAVALQYTLQRLLAIKALTVKDALDEASDHVCSRFPPSGTPYNKRKLRGWDRAIVIEWAVGNGQYDRGEADRR